MKIVLDCNVLLVAIPSRSPYHSIFRKILDGSLQLIVSNEILLEYMEIIALKSKPEIAVTVVDAIIANPGTIVAEPFYKFNLITANGMIISIVTWQFQITLITL